MKKIRASEADSEIPIVALTSHATPGYRENVLAAGCTGFGLIISNILIPVIDWIQFCRECKGDDELKDIPFVFYTDIYTDAQFA